MGIGSLLKKLFGGGGKESTAAPAEELQAPAPAVKEDGVDLYGATMVFTRVPKSTAWFVVKSGGEPGHIFELNEDRVTVGKDPDSGIHIDHTSVSPSHALIRVGQGSYTVFDLGSETGTSVNGNAVTGVSLADGARISMGGSELVYTAVGGGQQQEGEVGSSGVLLVRSGPSSGTSFPIGEGDLVLGRKPGDGGAQIEDTSVSQRHVLVRATPESCMVYDLGSANGTKVNDVLLSGSALQDKDLVKFGEAELQFVLAPSA